MPEETTPDSANEQASNSTESPSPQAAGDAEQKPAKKIAAKKPPKTEAAGTADDKPAAKLKKEKAPVLEDKPFADYIQQDYLPALKAGLAEQGIQDVELSFEKRKINVTGFSQAPECWQVVGHWNSSSKQTREFSLYFFDENINGKKGFSYSESGGKPSTIESFRIDERKVDLSLLVFWTLQRLNAQKWLVRN
ncbi:MAG: DUF2996 domain-containing protein [Leptolyngbyaceae cyanobacterium RU_5_1]|nr:DUF2996 domain-containing protein [Leptolyngbyaceae cyanobacterium RU_5_1]